MMTGDIYIAIAIIAMSLFMLFSLLRFIRVFYKNPQVSVQRIRLNKNSYLSFSFMLILNLIFTLGFVSDIFFGTQDIDLVAILFYVIGLSIVMLKFSFDISKIYKVK